MINATPHAAQELLLTDEEGRDLLVVVVKGTYRIPPDGPLVLADEQVPVDVAGTYYGDPDTSSHRFEPEVAPFKLATDVVLVGHAHAPRLGTTQLDVGFQVGPVTKVVRVFGDRAWYMRMGFRAVTDPEPFETMPLVFERAFGGWDRTAEDPDRHAVEARNPVGVGFHGARHGVFVEGAPLPNLEDLRQPIRDYTDTPPPAGFGFTGPGWTPRAALAGTYDDAWTERRMPLLPEDFDPRFYNAAPADQIAPGHLAGDEPVTVVNASPSGRLSFRLPGVPPPACIVEVDGTEPLRFATQLDTVIVDTDAMQVLLLWRGRTPIPAGPHAVREITVGPAPVAAASAPAYAY